MRKDINIDEREIDILAESRKVTRPIFKKMAILGFAAMVIGGFVEVNGNSLGFILMFLGALVLGVFTYLSYKAFKKSKADFITYVKSNNRTPPMPEEKKS